MSEDTRQDWFSFRFPAAADAHAYTQLDAATGDMLVWVDALGKPPTQTYRAFGRVEVYVGDDGVLQVDGLDPDPVQ